MLSHVGAGEKIVTRMCKNGGGAQWSERVIFVNTAKDLSNFFLLNNWVLTIP